MLDDLFILIPKKYYQILQIQGVLKYKIQKGSKRRIKGKLENRVSKKSQLDFPDIRPKADSALGTRKCFCLVGKVELAFLVMDLKSTRLS